MPNESSTLFSDLLGNEELKKTLQRLVEKKALPRVLLFHGPKGVGKCQFALQLAKQLTGSTISVDLQTLTPEGKNDVYSAERVRLLLEHAQLPPHGEAKAFILDDAHKMLPASSNAFLKMLEEPPLHTYFFLLTTHKEALLPTILSRCQTFPFSPLSTEEVVTWLESQKRSNAKHLAVLAQGSLFKAKLLLSKEIAKCFALIRKLFSLSLPQEYETLAACAEELEQIVMKQEEEDLLPLCIEEILLWLRDIECVSVEPSRVYHLNEIDLLRKWSHFLHQPLSRCIEELARVHEAIMNHVRIKAAMEHAFVWLHEMMLPRFDKMSSDILR